MSSDNRHRLPADEAAFRLDELAAAYAQPELEVFGQGGTADAEAEQAAWVLARALGYCRLFGIEAEELDGVLPPNAAMAAARELSRQAEQWRGQLDEFPAAYFDAVDSAEAEAECDAVLVRCMDAWAAAAVIHEAYEQCLDEDDEAVQEEFGRELDRLSDAVDAYDEAALAQADLLSEVAESRLLDNWRAFLVEPWNQMLPWWLNGTLERTAEALDRAVAATLPAPPPRPQPGRLDADKQDAGGIVLRRPAVLPVQLSAADLPAGSSQSCFWTSPDGQWQAQLTLAVPWPPDSAPVIIAFDHLPEYEPAGELAGRTVQLGSGKAKIDAEGRATILLGDLRDRELRLVVDGFEQPWVPNRTGDLSARGDT